MPFDTPIFEEASKVYFAYKKRTTFDLLAQNGLKTLLELHADETTLSVFLLHQVPLDQRLDSKWTRQVASLLASLDGLKYVTSLSNLKIEQSSESVRKMLLAMSKDLRVVLVLMALRYAELFEVYQMSSDLQRKIAHQTLDIYVPIAGRLGIYTLKRKLEDMCFSFIAPDDYEAFVDDFDKREELSQLSVEHLVKQLFNFLESKNLHISVSGRVKGKFSTYMKLKRKGGGSLDDIYDLLALRVVVPKQTDCYTVLSFVNNHWQPIMGRFKDYIAMPKINGYRSLHTTVLGMLTDLPRPVEIQIRTKEMHEEAEFGVAAHWWYEENAIKRKTRSLQFVGRSDYHERLKWVKNLVDFQDAREGSPGKEMSFFSDRIFAMTLNGRVVELPKGSTPLDFAYALSVPMGHHCVKAKVNGSVVSLDYELKNGDKVFIVQKMESSPNLYWLSLVRTEHARKAIRSWFLDQEESSVLNNGLKLINDAFRRYHQKPLDQEFSVLRFFHDPPLSLLERRELVVKVGRGDIDAESLVRSLVPEQVFRKHERVTVSPIKSKKFQDIIVGGEKGFKIKLAACCHPVQLQSIVGYVTRGGFISVHRQSCKVLFSLDKRRIVEARWTNEPDLARDVQLEVEVSSAHMLVELSDALKERKIVLKSFEYDAIQHGFCFKFDLLVPSEKILREMLSDWKSLHDVVSVRVVGVQSEGVEMLNRV